MELEKPPPEIALAGLRAIKTVALADGIIHDLERALIDSVQKYILGTDHAFDAIEPIKPKELAEAVPKGVYRDRILRGCVITALIDTQASKTERDVVEAFADALEVDRAPFDSLHRIVAGRLRLFRLDVGRRSFIGHKLGQHVEMKGVRGLAEIAAGFAGFENPKLADKYRALEKRAEGTLGRGYFDFMKKNEFAFSGEKGGAPEPIVFHDCVHVLAEYGTSAEEEVQIIGFQSGFQRYDPFFSILFGIAQFHLGLQLSPVATSATRAIDPEKLLRALKRGTAVNLDLSDKWDPWSDFDVPVEELRKRYNILPRD